MRLDSGIAEGERPTRAKFGATAGALARLGLPWVRNSLCIGRAPKLGRLERGLVPSYLAPLTPRPSGVGPSCRTRFPNNTKR
jgi:hypothetical protein